MSDSPPNYYAILEIAPTVTEEQIKTAYKKAALKWHPDRVAHDSPERPQRTKKFQQINDAYYTLSDKTRRRDYDEARQWHSSNTTPGSFGPDDVPDEDADEEVPRRPKQTGGSFWSWFTSGERDSQATADAQFSSAFEDMLHNDLSSDEDGTAKPNSRFWAIVGTLSGAGLGFIIANVPGAAAGGAAGNRLGNIRDQKGQSVYKTFQELPQGEKSKLLSELAAKLFAGAIS